MSSVYALRLKSLTNSLSKTSGVAVDYTSPPVSPTRPLACTAVTPGVCRNYELLALVGEGTYGQVFKAQHIGTGRVVAIKKIINHMKSDEHIQNEINLLDQIRHKNIVELIDRFDSSSEDSICAQKSCDKRRLLCEQTIAQYLVFEFCDFDLHQILYGMRLELSLAHIKNILQQILEGAAFIHERQVLHRDLKPENILVNAAGKVRIADFGFAKSLSLISWSGFSSKVVTLAYRAPELLVGYRFYERAIDMWSIGCLMAEFWTRAGPLMSGTDEYQQLIQISKLCGPINSISLLGVNNMYFMSDLYLPQMHKRKVRQMFAIKCVDECHFVDLFDRLLCLNIDNRISAANALKHPLFATQPIACDISQTLHSLFISSNTNRKNCVENQCNTPIISHFNANNTLS